MSRSRSSLCISVRPEPLSQNARRKSNNSLVFIENCEAVNTSTAPNVHFGAQGRTRTGTFFRTADFKSLYVANPCKHKPTWSMKSRLCLFRLVSPFLCLRGHCAKYVPNPWLYQTAEFQSAGDLPYPACSIGQIVRRLRRLADASYSLDIPVAASYPIKPIPGHSRGCSNPQ
jgi:hypothetical protein